VTDALREHSGRLLDPDIVAAFLAHEDEILGEALGRDPFDAVLAAEPAPVRTVSPSELVEVAAAIGRIADLKSTFTLGHSSGVAALAVAGGRRMGLGDEVVASLEVAALLHDIGRVGISNDIWHHPGPLSQAGWEQVRLHAYHSERILARSGALHGLAPLVGMHHERLDGSGYHRGVRGTAIPPGARLLAAADALDAMTHDRPHRQALTPDEAVVALSEDVRSGRLDSDAVAAVIGAADLGTIARGRPRLERVAGLSEREVEVLRLVARGLSNREIAEQLVVSTRTAEHHVQHIYAKIGLSSRAAAALFAMEHALLE
jgi:HD-GYP domain-containing protein (c-di-GMP phosphodiesterase class II)/DNA-binding CsgD family transcriptional regulator